MINLIFINGGVWWGLYWGSFRFYIFFLDFFCKLLNRYIGLLGKGCINVVGFMMFCFILLKVFKRVCFFFYLYYKDDIKFNLGVVYGCNNGSNYEVVFCLWRFKVWCLRVSGI